MDKKEELVHGEGTGIRYHLSIKLKAVTDYYQGVDKKEIVKNIGCSIQSLDDWIEKHGEEVKAYHEEHNIPLKFSHYITAAPPTQPKRRPNGSLEFTEEERVEIVKESDKRGVKVVAEERFINRSTLGRWRQCYKLSGYTLKSLYPTRSDVLLVCEAPRKLERC